MAEPIKKTYISAREFVDSWEKEIYELSNLDYFIYLLINELASGIEKQYFARLNPANPLFLQSDEIGTLSFNLSDSIQLFLENNCFSTCSLNCPIKLDEDVNADSINFRFLAREEKSNKPESCRIREELLYFDLLNYVISDAVIDFYNFEIEIEININNSALLELTEAIMKIVMDFIRKNGPKYLSEPRESSGYLFDRLLKMDTDLWEERYDQPDDDINDEEGEEWKKSQSEPKYVFHDFRESTQFSSSSDLKILNKFEDFIVDFLDIDNIVELSHKDIEEFFAIVAVNEMILEDKADLKTIIQIFKKFIAYLEFNYKMFIKDEFDLFCTKRIPGIERTFKITRSYKKTFPLIHYMLSDEKKDDSLTDGFFEIINRNGYLFQLKDIHLKSTYKNVDLRRLKVDSLKKGDILHGQITRQNSYWNLIHLEMIYPNPAKYYLF